ncbi:MAG: hypothetical protein IPM82_11980 [Saprospiraceae bacterium]|nr:hypothetical protein [Saprospiraceae bacterium]
MASDTSRKIFDPSKHYNGVLMQQGRVQLDSDWNEQLDIHQYRTHTETKDVIGQSGVPKNGNYFRITAKGINDLKYFGGAHVRRWVCFAIGRNDNLSESAILPQRTISRYPKQPS